MEAGLGEGTFVPYMPKRITMNSILLNAIGVSTLGLAVPYLNFFLPPVPPGSGAGLVANDALAVPCFLCTTRIWRIWSRFSC